jgi:hypothetical protein
MNRRSFIKGLLAATAAAPIARVAPALAEIPVGYWVGDDGLYCIRLQMLREALLPGLWEIACTTQTTERVWTEAFKDVES